MMTLPQVLEGLLFASPKPLALMEVRAILKSAAEFTEEPLAAALSRSREQEILDAFAALAASYRQAGRAFILSEEVDGWQLKTAASCAPWVRQLFPETRPTRLSSPALETLAIIAYRQPVTRAEVESVRGVDAGGVVQTLLERGLVRIAGRAEVPGRPLLYATTHLFFEHFGIKDVAELPAFDELKRSVQVAETASATAPLEASEPQSPELALEPPAPELCKTESSGS